VRRGPRGRRASVLLGLLRWQQLRWLRLLLMELLMLLMLLQ
jgi:hypothetical protein